MDMTNHAIVPLEHLVELESSAYNATPRTTGDRIAGTAQTAIVCAVLAGAVTAAAWGIAKAQDRLEENRFKRAHQRPNKSVGPRAV